MSLKFFPGRWAVGAGLLAGLALRPVRAEDSVSWKGQDYREAGGRIAVQAQYARWEQDLGPDLHRIATIREDCGAVAQHHCGAGRAGEAGQPGEAVVGLGQIFVLVLVLVRDQQAVEALLGHFRADAGKMLRPEGRIGGFVEGLAHG